MLAEVIKPDALPMAMRADAGPLLRLGDVYSQLNAAVGEFGLNTLSTSTRALASGSAGDATDTKIENQLVGLGEERDAIVSLMKSELLGAAFAGHRLGAREAKDLIQTGEDLLAQSSALAR